MLTKLKVDSKKVCTMDVTTELYCLTMMTDAL